MTVTSFMRLVAAAAITFIAIIGIYEAGKFMYKASQVREIMITPHERNVIQQLDAHY